MSLLSPKPYTCNISSRSFLLFNTIFFLGLYRLKYIFYLSINAYAFCNEGHPLAKRTLFNRSMFNVNKLLEIPRKIVNNCTKT